MSPRVMGSKSPGMAVSWVESTGAHCVVEGSEFDAVVAAGTVTRWTVAILDDRTLRVALECNAVAAAGSVPTRAATDFRQRMRTVSRQRNAVLPAGSIARWTTAILDDGFCGADAERQGERGRKHDASE